MMSGLPPICCPYCGNVAVLSNGARPVYACKPCDARVGCHPGSTKPLGQLANRELRGWRIKAHAAFDRLWVAKLAREGGPKGRARGAGYKWLAEQMGIGRDDCHIGLFDIDQCRRVVEICKPFHGENRRVGDTGSSHAA